MAKITAKDSKLMNTVRRAFEKSKADVTFSELLQASRLDSVSLTNALTLLRATQENGYWYLPADKSAGVPSPEEVIAEKGGTWELGRGEQVLNDTSKTGRKIDEALAKMGFTPSQDTPADDNATHVSSPTTEVSSPNNETLTNPNTGREYIEMPETGNSIKQVILAQIEKSRPFVNRKRAKESEENAGNTSAKKFRNRPFTPNPITGYQVQKGKAKIFLDRKATSRTLTLSLTDLKELVNAVEKAERVA